MPHANPEERRAYMRDWRRRTGKQKEYDAKRVRTKDARRKHRLKSDYGITQEDYADMWEAQDGKCAICGGVNKDGRLLLVDHDHKTGKVRGLLCHNCNVMLGNAKDKVEVLAAGIAYLEVHRA